jgi:hypothetical protein
MDQKNISVYGQIGVSVLSQLIFAGTVIVAFFLRDTSILLLVVGAVIANATTTVNFWTGSSSGSQGKDAALAAAATKPGNGNQEQPVAIAINNPEREDKP